MAALKEGSPPGAAQNAAPTPAEPSAGRLSYEERKEWQRRLRKVEKTVKDCEAAIEKMEQRLAELDTLLSTPEGAADMKLVGEYAEVKKRLDAEVERWEDASLQLEEIQQENS